MITGNTHQHLKEDLLVISRYFTFFLSPFPFILSLFKLSGTKKHHVYNQHRILYTCNVLHSAGNMHWWRFPRRLFFYSQQNISAVANEFLIPYNLVKSAAGTQNL